MPFLVSIWSLAYDMFILGLAPIIFFIALLHVFCVPITQVSLPRITHLFDSAHLHLYFVHPHFLHTTVTR